MRAGCWGEGSPKKFASRIDCRQPSGGRRKMIPVVFQEGFHRKQLAMDRPRSSGTSGGSAMCRSGSGNLEGGGAIGSSVGSFIPVERHFFLRGYLRSTLGCLDEGARSKGRACSQKKRFDT